MTHIKRNSRTKFLPRSRRESRQDFGRRDPFFFFFFSVSDIYQAKMLQGHGDKPKSAYSYFEKGYRQKCARDDPESDTFCCFPLARANIRPWPLMPFFQISLKNSELKTTQNTFRDCRVHFFRQPFSK